MRNQLTLFIGIVIAMVLVAHTILFQVRYDELAVKASFGKATEASIKRPAKLPYWRWPWPINSIQRYPTRLQLLEHQLTQVQTADRYSVIIATHLVWRITDPLKFFRNAETVAKAEEHLVSRVANTQGIISSYRFTQLVNVDSGQIKIPVIEQEAEQKIQEDLTAQDFGITVERFGITRILLPETVTETVFEQMRETRQRLAQGIRSSGVAEAQQIRSDANLIKDQILAYANNYAEQIKAQGNREATQYVEVFKKNEEFAIFLRKIQSLEKFLPNFTTLILPADEVLSPDKLLSYPKK